MIGRSLNSSTSYSLLYRYVQGWMSFGMTHFLNVCGGEGSSGDSVVILSEKQHPGESPSAYFPSSSLNLVSSRNSSTKKNKLFNNDPICGRMRDLLDEQIIESRDGSRTVLTLSPKANENKKGRCPFETPSSI